jgi:hypothetical protein
MHLVHGAGGERGEGGEAFARKGETRRDPEGFTQRCGFRGAGVNTCTCTYLLRGKAYQHPFAGVQLTEVVGEAQGIFSFRHLMFGAHAVRRGCVGMSGMGVICGGLIFMGSMVVPRMRILRMGFLVFPGMLILGCRVLMSGVIIMPTCAVRYLLRGVGGWQRCSHVTAEEQNRKECT